VTEVSLYIKDEISGHETNIDDVEDSLSLSDFLHMCEQNGFGPFSQLDSNGGIVVDGNPHPWTPEIQKVTLVKLGVVDGSSITVTLSLIVA
jgi:hypothetical protein